MWLLGIVLGRFGCSAGVWLYTGRGLLGLVFVAGRGICGLLLGVLLQPIRVGILAVHRVLAFVFI